ncbi:MAG: hypothetical protein JKY50_00845 [Oleispira sp.]|nr:hypothetical protein [Oleispira sp.]
MMFGNRPVLMGGDDGDTGGGGSSFDAGPLRGGRGSPTGERQKSSFEQGASGAFASFVGSSLGGPLLGQAFKGVADRDTTFGVDLATGNRIRVTSPDGSGDDNSGIPGSNIASRQSRGGRNVASAQQLATQRADLAINRALGFQEAAAGRAETSLTEGRAAALKSLSPFRQTGVDALGQQSAFLGLSGADAEQAALAGFSQSPGAQFAQQEEEQAIIRNALALGDAGGGRVKDELATRASGRFGQRLDTRLAQLAQLSGQGQQAAFGESNIQQNTAANLSNLFLGTGENQASAVLGQQVASASAASEANRIAALEQQQKSQQDAAFQSQLFGLGASIAKPIISSFF